MTERSASSLDRDYTGDVQNVAAPRATSWPSVSVIVVAFASSYHLPTCLRALQRQTHAASEVIIVDTTPHDPLLESLQQEFHAVKFIDAGTNLGYAGGNNFGAAIATGEYLAILNPDTEVDEHWLEALVAAATLTDNPVIVTPKILLFDQRGNINTCGNAVHYTGIATCRGLQEKRDAYMTPEFVPAISGASFLMERDLFIRLGGFDERFFMYLEDTDLSWRAAMLGVRCLFVPGSIVYHHYQTRLDPRKFYLLERNRILMLLQNLRRQTLCALAPALLITELASWGFALSRGLLYGKAKFYAYSWLVKNQGVIRKTRQRVRRQRIVSDATVLRRFDHRLNVDQLSLRTFASLAKATANLSLLAWQRVLLVILRDGH